MFHIAKNENMKALLFFLFYYCSLAPVNAGELAFSDVQPVCWVLFEQLNLNSELSRRN